MVMFHPRPPRPDERALLDSALASMGAEASRWREQASLVEVQGMCDCDCETIDFGFPGTVREAGDHKREILADGTFEGDGVPFGVILHAHDGRLWELEIYSMTGERMGAYPSPGQVVWLPEPHHK